MIIAAFFLKDSSTSMMLDTLKASCLFTRVYTQVQKCPCNLIKHESEKEQLIKKQQQQNKQVVHSAVGVSVQKER